MLVYKLDFLVSYYSSQITCMATVTVQVYFDANGSYPGAETLLNTYTYTFYWSTLTGRRRPPAMVSTVGQGGQSTWWSTLTLAMMGDVPHPTTTDLARSAECRTVTDRLRRAVGCFRPSVRPSVRLSVRCDLTLTFIFRWVTTLACPG